jgi:hypothetical protein
MPHDIQSGLSQLDLSPLKSSNENLGLPGKPIRFGRGGLRWQFFSVAAGMDNPKAARHPRVVEWADSVVLNKVDPGWKWRDSILHRSVLTCSDSTSCQIIRAIGFKEGRDWKRPGGLGAGKC